MHEVGSKLDQPAWRNRFLAKRAELSARPIELVWIGDSIVQQFELAGPEPWRQYRPVWDRFYASRNAINLGFAGDETKHILWRVKNGIGEGVHPRLVVLLAGANNLSGPDCSGTDVATGIEAIVDALRTRMPSSNVLVIGVLPSVRSAWITGQTEVANALLGERYRDEPRVTFVDLRALFLNEGAIDPDLFVDPRRTPPAPPLHPTAEAQLLMAEALEPTMKRLLSEPD